MCDNALESELSAISEDISLAFQWSNLPLIGESDCLRGLLAPPLAAPLSFHLSLSLTTLSSLNSTRTHTHMGIDTHGDIHQGENQPLLCREAPSLMNILTSTSVMLRSPHFFHSLKGNYLYKDTMHVATTTMHHSRD